MMGNLLSEKSWPIALVAVTGSAALLFVFAALSWMNVVCETSGTEAGKPLVLGVGGCIEFWLNRYQSSVAALVAIFAAGLAWKGVQGQIETSKQQVDVANRQFAASALAPLQQRVETLRKLRDVVVRATESLYKVERLSDKIIDIMRADIDDNPGDMSEAIRFITRNNGDARQQVSLAIEKLDSDIRELIITHDKETYESAVGEELRKVLYTVAVRGKIVKRDVEWINNIAIDAYDMTEDHIRTSWDRWLAQYINSKNRNRDFIITPVIVAAEARLIKAVDKTIRMIEE